MLHWVGNLQQGIKIKLLKSVSSVVGKKVGEFGDGGRERK